MLIGTSVIKLSIFLDNLKDIAGTCYLTRSEYDVNTEKPCSYSHINRLFSLKWNDCLNLAGLPIKRRLPIPSTQGRKAKDKSMAKIVECLNCTSMFESFDPRINRICKKCKDLENRYE